MNTPIHVLFSQTRGFDRKESDLLRRLLVLSCDHGLEPSTFAVRAVASTGASPWRVVQTGLSVAHGRRSHLARYAMLGRFVADILSSGSAEEILVQRLQEGDELPGFSRSDIAKCEPRARTVLSALAQFNGKSEFLRLFDIVSAAEAIGGYFPDFAFLATFCWLRLGFSTADSPFLMARSAGWIAHAIEQYQVGERERRELEYRGPLPQLAKVRAD